MGCRRANEEVSERLDRAEAIVMTDADSASSILQGINPKLITDNEAKARYNLLIAMARYRMNDYQQPETDSLLCSAIDYYNNHFDSSRLMKSLFLRADIRAESNDFANAMKDALRAYALAQKDTSDYWRAKTSGQLSDILAFTNNFSESIPFIKESKTYYERSGRKLDALYAECDLGVAYVATGEAQKGSRILDKIYRIAKDSLQSNELLFYVVKNRYHIYYKDGAYNEALEALRQLKQIDPEYEYSSGDYAVLANIMTHTNQLNLAKQYLDSATCLSKDNFDNAAYYKAHADIYQATGQYDKMVESIDSLWGVVALETDLSLQNSAVSTQSAYYQEESAKQKSGKERIRLVLIVCVTCLVVILGIVLAFSSLRVRRKNVEILNKMKEVESLANQLDGMTAETSTLKARIVMLFKEQWATLNSIAGRYVDNPKDPITQDNVFKEFERALKQFSQKKNVVKLIECVNEYMDGILDDIKRVDPDLDNTELTIIALDLAGISPKTICFIVDYKIKNLYSKRERLYAQINKKAGPELVEKLDKLRS